MRRQGFIKYVVGLLGRERAHLGLGVLLRYRDGSIGLRERQRVEAHLGQCEACREQMEFLRFVETHYSKAFADLPPVSGEHLTANDMAAFLDLSLESPRHPLLEGHMAGCSECLTELLRLKAVLKSPQGARPSQTVLQAIMTMGNTSTPAGKRASRDRLAVAIRQWLGPAPLSWRPVSLTVGAIAAAIATWSVLQWSMVTTPGPTRSPPAVVFEGEIPITPAIAKNVSEYRTGAPSKEKDDVLLQALAQEARELPIERIKSLDLDQELVARLKAGQAPLTAVMGLRLQLTPDGTLRLALTNPPPIDFRFKSKSEPAHKRRTTKEGRDDDATK